MGYLNHGETFAEPGRDPCRAMWLAVLLQAIMDLDNPDDWRDREFMASRNFDNVCSLAGLNPDYVRRAVSRDTMEPFARKAMGRR